MPAILLNFTLFQLGWFACVLSGAANAPWIGVAIAAVIITIHTLRAVEWRKEILLISIAMLFGAVWDSFLVWQHWLDYTSGYLIEDTAPFWIIAMWGLFATTLNISLRWLKQKLILAALFGSLAGPLAYYAGQQLGAVWFLDKQMALLALTLGWAVFTPLLMKLSIYLDGYSVGVVRKTA